MSKLLQKKEKQFRQVFNKILKMEEKNIENVAENEKKQAMIMPKNQLEYLKVDVKIDNKEFRQEEFINELSNHPELLERLSTERLKKILEYISKENNKKKALISSLKS